jgi:hypothetical protein
LEYGNKIKKRKSINSQVLVYDWGDGIKMGWASIRKWILGSFPRA